MNRLRLRQRACRFILMMNNENLTHRSLTYQNQTFEKLDWQDLARQASEEMDPERLLELVRRLNNALEKTNGRTISSIIRADNVADAA
jgi:hypothetical protein